MCDKSLLSCWFQNSLCLCLSNVWLQCVSIWIFLRSIPLEFGDLLGCYSHVPIIFRKFLTIISFAFSHSYSHSLYVGHLGVYHISLRLFLLFFTLAPLNSSDSIISIVLSLGLLILSSAYLNLPVNSSSDFFFNYTFQFQNFFVVFFLSFLSLYWYFIIFKHHFLTSPHHCLVLWAFLS